MKKKQAQSPGELPVPDTENLFRLLAEQMNDIVWTADLELKPTYVSPSIRKVLGFTPEERLQQSLSAKMPPATLRLVKEKIKEELTRDRERDPGRSITLDLDFFHRDGSIRTLETSLSFIRDEEGNPTGIYGLSRDVTDRHWVEDALRKSEARFKNILLYAPLAIQGYRTDGTVVYWNREAERVYGYSAEKAIGRNLGDLIIPEEIRPFFEESLGGCAGLEQSGEFMEAGDVSLLRKDGSRVLVHSIHTAVCVEGEEPMLFCIDLDLTDRQRMEAERLKMERQLQQTQKMESLGVLAGGVAHDFNNILMVILGNAELALKEMGSLSPARESVSEISAAARQASELCKQMLAYGGRASFVQEPLNLAALIKETAPLIKVSTSRGVVLKYELESGLVEGDPSQLRQVVMNLVINSSEAIGERRGVVTIATGKVSLDQAEASSRDSSGKLQAGEYVFLRVADNGRGMDEATRRRVFEPFFTTKFTGRGLGLAAVLGIVQGHGGTISVESEPELGTTFQVLLPALGP
ncbi:MAG: PAS domain S-box protein [Candidatus Erginobacter occultus]|nr:PAS domain S-box protein [Candidatus Erginobacter occultus]